MWNEKRSGSQEHHQGEVKTSKPNGNRCHLTAEELEFLNADTIFARVHEIQMPMSEAQPLITAANRLGGSFQSSDRVPGYKGYISVPSGRSADLTAMSKIMVLGGFPVSDSPEHERGV